MAYIVRQREYWAAYSMPKRSPVIFALKGKMDHLYRRTGRGLGPPARGSGQEFFEIPLVGLSLGGSGLEVFEFSRTGSGHRYPTRPNPRGLTRPVNNI